MSSGDSKSRKLIPIGIVLSLIGVITVVGVDGVKRILGIGDNVNQGDNLASGDSSDVVIGFADGTSIRLGPNGEAVLDADVFDLSIFGDDANISELLQDMQAAILAGQDPSAILEAAAAGELSNSEGNTTHVRVAHDATDPDAGVSYASVPDSDSGGRGAADYQMPEGSDALAGINVGSDGTTDDEDPGNGGPGSGGPGNGGPDIVGTSGDDILHGTGADEIIDGLEGDDLIMGGGGNDTLIGGDGKDTLEAKGGDDTLLGGKQNDILNGGAGDDTLDGGKGDDLLEGHVGNDELLGGPGNDTLIGGKGDDLLEGGTGADVFKFTDIKDGVDTILDLNAKQDKIDISDLLDGYDPSDLTDDITNWVKVDTTSEDNIFDLHVDTNGGGDNFSRLASVQVLEVGLGGTAPSVDDVFNALITNEIT